MKKYFCVSIFAYCIFLTATSQEIKSMKVGNQVWMMSNVNSVVPGSWNYNDDPSFGNKYGRLYTYESAKKACPSGWHLPTVQDWSDLLVQMGGEDNAVPMMMKSYGEGGFNAKLGGIATVGNFQLIDNYGAFWTATENDKDNAWYIYFTPKSKSVTTSYSIKTHGLSVRCVKKNK